MDFVDSTAFDNFITLTSFSCVSSDIAREMLWRDGLHLINEGTNMLSNNFLLFLYVMIIGFLQLGKQIRAEQKVVIKVLRSFPQKILRYQS